LIISRSRKRKANSVFHVLGLPGLLDIAGRGFKIHNTIQSFPPEVVILHNNAVDPVVPPLNSEGPFCEIFGRNEVWGEPW
jgi:hypothetical protein